MPYRKERLITGNIYHIVIRGIDENSIFKDINDNYRGIFSIYEFNNIKAVVIRDRRSARARIKRLLNNTNKDQRFVIDPREKLVEILAFCFMTNHLHLLVKQLKDDGITKFMRKLGAGYGGYFNKKYNRKGHVFQNNFKAVQIKSDEQLMVVWAYIHANPISLIEPSWKEKGIKNTKKVIKFLENYKWSSYQDYLMKNNFPSVTKRELILTIIGNNNKSRKFLNDYIRHKGRVKEFSELTLE